jgi:hypothetical protein
MVASQRYLKRPPTRLAGEWQKPQNTNNLKTIGERRKNQVKKVK